MGGSVSAVSAAGRTRFGPAKGTGLARVERNGSVRMLRPAVCSSTVECPTQVAFRASPATRSGGGGKASVLHAPRPAGALSFHLPPE